ncbi:MAG TPA: GDCCVxC domain-containing (seleno)protein [Terriglobales bacterium]|nr:GDCCVxC domain-containing (seleno)protein [Terriglobales bacterium]
MLCWSGRRRERIARGAPLVTSMDTAAVVVLQSVVSCPQCGTARQETMPTDSCRLYYECSHCKTVLRPKAGDCCVFCSYGSVTCPPVQAHGHCHL